MKKTLTTLAVLGFSVATALAVAPPYSSDFFTGISTLDEGWTTINNGNKKAKSWEYDRENSFELAGKSGGAYKSFDPDYNADCWLVSPAISLETGTTYTMTVLAKTRDTDSEALEIMLGNNATSEALSAGTHLYRETNLKSPYSYTTITKEFTVSEAGDYFIGLHCFSEVNHYDLSVTGFSVTDGTGGGETPPDPVDPSAPASIPWSQTFAEEPTGWTYVNGPDTQSTSTWCYNDWNEAIKMDFTEGQKEDHWAITPAINFAEAGTYALELSGIMYGKLNFHIGTDTSDLNSFSKINGEFEGEEYDYNGKYVFSVETPGTYHIGIQACAEKGAYLGYRIKSIAVKPHVKALINITDLKVKTFETPVKVELTATYPAVFNNGEPLDVLTKAEILRDDVVIETIENPVPGSALQYTDTPEPGCYTYSVKVYGAENSQPEDAPMSVKSGYVGKPYIDMPTEAIKFTDIEEEELDKWLLNGWYSNYGILTSVSNADGSVDNRLMSPYISLEPGNYRLTINGKTYMNGFSVGLSIDRMNIAENNTQIYDCPNDDSYSSTDKVIEFEITEAGDYSVYIHHYKGSSYSYYNTVTLNSFKLTKIVALPKAVTELSGTTNEACDEAILSWVNPSKTNLGEEIEGSLTIKIKRDDELLTTLNGKPGQTMHYTDQDIPDHGKHIYTIIAANQNGEQEDEIPSITIDFKVPVGFPYSADFNDWNTGDDWNYWKISEEGYLTFPESFTGYNDYAISPMMEFKDNEKYEVSAVFENSTASVNLRFGQGEDGSNHKIIHVFPAPASDAEETMKVNINCSNATQSEPAEIHAKAEGNQEDDENESASATVQVTPAKGYISLHMASQGKVCMKSFAITKLNSSGSGIETIFAAGDGISYADGTANLPEGTLSYSVFDLNGNTLASGQATSTIDLRHHNGTLIIVARTASAQHTLKVIR